MRAIVQRVTKASVTGKTRKTIKCNLCTGQVQVHDWNVYLL